MMPADEIPLDIRRRLRWLPHLPYHTALGRRGLAAITLIGSFFQFKGNVIFQKNMGDMSFNFSVIVSTGNILPQKRNNFGLGRGNLCHCSKTADLLLKMDF